MRISETSLIGFTMAVIAMGALAIAAAPPARAESLKSVVRTLNAIVNPEDAWRLADQARRYRHREEEHYWRRYAAGLEQQRRRRGEAVPHYGGWDRYQTPIGPDEAYRLRDQARRFGRPEAQAYWQRYYNGLEHRQ